MEPVGSLFLRHLFSNFASAEPKCEESDSMTRVLCCSGSGTVVSIVVGRRPVSRCSYSFVLSGRPKTSQNVVTYVYLMKQWLLVPLYPGNRCNELATIKWMGVLLKACCGHEVTRLYSGLCLFALCPISI